jgi:anti-anti-sigma factor
MTEQILEATVGRTPSGTAVLAAAGEIDHGSRRVLEDLAERVLDEVGPRVILDLSLVTFCDSGGLSLCVELHRRTTARGGWLRVAGASGPVLTVLHVANLDRLFPLYDTVADADADGR